MLDFQSMFVQHTGMDICRMLFFLAQFQFAMSIRTFLSSIFLSMNPECRPFLNVICYYFYFDEFPSNLFSLKYILLPLKIFMNLDCHF